MIFTATHGMMMVDLALTGTLVSVMWRLLRQPSSSQHSERLIDLESSIKSLVREASAASEVLNVELQRRRDEIEGVLKDLEKSNIKSSKTLVSAEDIIKKLESKLLIATNLKLKTSDSESFVSPKKPLLSDAIKVRIDKVNKGNFENKNSSAASSEIIEKEGVKIEHFSLDKIIEKSTYNSVPYQKYFVAEQLLSTGKSINEIVDTTSLSTKDVKMISQLMK
jgi:hypothetical protein